VAYRVSIANGAVLKLTFGALVRAAERWKSIKLTEFEHHQLSPIKAELDQEYEIQVELNLTARVKGKLTA
jgi:hypothetical protein